MTPSEARAKLRAAKSKAGIQCAAYFSSTPAHRDASGVPLGAWGGERAGIAMLRAGLPVTIDPASSRDRMDDAKPSAYVHP